MPPTWRSRTAELSSTVRDTATRGLDTLGNASELSERARSAREIITPLGRGVIAVGVVAWILGWWFGWLELMIVASACLFLLVVAAVFVAGRSTLHIEIALDPPRVTAGDPSSGQVVVTNRTGRRAPTVHVEVPVGAGLAVFDIPGLRPGQSSEDLFVISTQRRGVIPVGPATSVRGDPLGLLQRKASGSDPLELLVHPHTIVLEPFGSGLLKDLEGLTTKDLSSSDLSFHALREYVPGDDRRHIHWRSSAKAGELLVRQYLDTRRSTLCILTDAQESGYADPEEFEIALQIAGSVALRACRDGLPAVLVAGRHAATGVLPHVLLDVLARAELSKRAEDLSLYAARASAQGADISVAVVISGSLRTAEELDRARSRFPPDVRTLGIRVVPDAAPYLTVTSRGVVAQLSALRELPGLLRRELAA